MYWGMHAYENLFGFEPSQPIQRDDYITPLAFVKIV